MKKHIVIGIILLSIIIIFCGCQDISEPEINIIGWSNEDNIFLEHLGGDTIALIDITVVLTVENDTSELSSSDFEILNDNGDNSWNRGETITFYVGNLTDKYYDIMLIDKQSSSIVMSGELHGGILEIDEP